MKACPACGFEYEGSFKFCPECAAPLGAAAPARETRKTVTALFCDLVGSTALGETHDPEVLRPLLDRYFTEMRTAVERHGGRVEKFIGDAVAAVFGLPSAHEDDALRAVRAGVEMQERMKTLNVALSISLSTRIGITTGEVLVRGGGEPVGDAMNTASRLQSGAAPGTVLIGESTWRLVRDAIVAEPVEPLKAKGKSQPVPAWRVVQVASLSPMHTRRLDAPMVGRERESILLTQAFERAVSDHDCQLFTVLGTAGAGKSRLVEEFIAGLNGAEILQGRCLPYGDDITFFPVAEAMKQALEIVDFDDESSVRSAIFEAVKTDEHADTITANLAKLLAAGEGGSPEETFWAIRRLFEIRGRERPLVVVLDDIHWGEETFLDLIEHIADWSRDASILLLCMARPDLLDIQPSWAGGKTNASTISLAPLSEAESEELISHLLGSSALPDAIQRKITGAAEGNPLFVEEMLRMLVDEELLSRHGDRWVPAAGLDKAQVPPTISALLSARLDRLSQPDRAVIERAAVVGKTFHRGAVVSLLPEAGRGELDVSLRSLVRKELIVPERSLLPGEDAYRFRHLLIRDAAYDQIPKADRADVHAGFADWLEELAGDRIAEQEEVAGYHLEQAHRYRIELGMVGNEGLELARRAAEHLASAGHRASARGDYPAAAGLFERALALMSPGAEARPRSLLALGIARFQEGRIEEAEAAFNMAIEGGRAAGDRGLEWHARMHHSYVDSFAHPERVDLDQLRSQAEQAIEIFTEVDDDLGLSLAHALRSNVAYMTGHARESIAAGELAVRHARKVGGHDVEARGSYELAYSLLFGPTEVTAGLKQCEELLERAGGNRLAEFSLLAYLGSFEALDGRFDAAREHVAAGRRTAEDLGLMWDAGMLATLNSYIETLAGDRAAAERAMRAALEVFEANGDRWYVSTAVVDLARTICEQGRYEEALDLAGAFDRTPAPFDMEWLIKSVGVRALALAGCGRAEEAEAIAREAVRLAEQTDFLNIHGDAAFDLAKILLQLDRRDDAAVSAKAALELYERKGNVVSLGQAGRFLADLSGA